MLVMMQAPQKPKYLIIGVLGQPKNDTSLYTPIKRDRDLVYWALGRPL